MTKWWDPLDLSKQKILLDLVYMHPGGVRTASDLFFIWKSAIMKHPSKGPVREKTVAPAAPRKLKLLCLHGYRQSGKVAREKLGSFRKAVNDTFEKTIANK